MIGQEEADQEVKPSAFFRYEQAARCGKFYSGKSLLLSMSPGPVPPSGSDTREAVIAGPSPVGKNPAGIV
jgi:hypothetical protein